MLNCQKQSVLLLKGEKKENYEKDSYISVLSGDGGYDVTCVPVLGFQFVNLNLLRDALDRPDEYSCLVLTSPRAVEAVAKMMTYTDRTVWGQKVTFVVGATTGQLAENIGLTVKGSESGNSEKLQSVIIKDLMAAECMSGKTVLFPCGNMKLEILPNALQAAGLSMNCLTVYETSADSNLRKNLEAVMQNKGPAEYIVFFSPSGVEYVLGHLQQLGFLIDGTKLVAMGPSTAKAIESKGASVWGTAAQPTVDHLMLLMKSELALT